MNTLPLSPWLTRLDPPQSPVGLTLVVAAHLAIVWGILHSRDEPVFFPQPHALQVHLISPEHTKPAQAQPIARSQPAQHASIPLLTTLRVTARSSVAPMPAAMPTPINNTPQKVATAAPSAVPTPTLASAAPAVMTAPRFDANYLDNPAPVYPPLSRRLGEEGRVLLRVFVGADGLPGKIELHQSSGYSRLDNVALETVQRWRFVSARLGHESVGAWVVVPISFSLRS